jgi:hypothetical protein
LGHPGMAPGAVLMSTSPAIDARSISCHLTCPEVLSTDLSQRRPIATAMARPMIVAAARPKTVVSEIRPHQSEDHLHGR